MLKRRRYWSFKKAFGDLRGGRGRLIRLEDRLKIAQDIEQAQADGARLEPACHLAGITPRTLANEPRFAETPPARIDEATKSAWCRSHGIYPTELEKWRLSAVEALASPHEARATPQGQRRQ